MKFCELFEVSSFIENFPCRSRYKSHKSLNSIYHSHEECVNEMLT